MLNTFKKLIYIVALLCFVVLTVTGFYPLLILGRSLYGYWVMAHITAGAIFAGCLAVLAILLAERHRFNQGDWPWLQHIIQPKTESQRRPAEQFGLMQKIAFWLIMLLALPVILSIVLMMFPLFGTYGQEFLLQVHRYSSIALTLAVIAYNPFYLTIAAGKHKMQIRIRR